MSVFSASVQYNDFKGSVAADRSDNLSLSAYLVEQELIKSDERVVGCRISFGGNSGDEVDHGIVFYLQGGSFDEPSDTIKAIETDMPIQKLLSFFKRFDMVMSIDGNSFEGTKVDGPHYE